MSIFDMAVPDVQPDREQGAVLRNRLLQGRRVFGKVPVCIPLNFIDPDGANGDSSKQLPQSRVKISWSANLCFP
jgi:hypothetical protein